jgi:multidrug transporter EmrE-like cation transporter
MKPAAGFTRLGPSIAVFVCFALGILLDVYLVRSLGDVGPAVILIGGLEATFTVLMARLLFDESLDARRVAAMALVLSGVALLDWHPKAAAEADRTISRSVTQAALHGALHGVGHTTVRPGAASIALPLPTPLPTPLATTLATTLPTPLPMTSPPPARAVSGPALPGPVLGRLLEPRPQLGPARDPELGVDPLQMRVDRPT